MRLQAWLFILAALIVSAGIGCRPNKQSRARGLELESDRARHLLENMIEEKRDPRGRVKTALAKLNDAVRDDVPFLISMDLGCTDQNQPKLFLMCLDEGRNLLGIHVREERIDANGKTATLEERYPLYIAWPETNVLANHMFSVELRRVSQRKDEDAWKDYIILVLEDLVHKFIYEGPVDEAVKVPPNEALDRKMPPIWISIPEANQVHVFVSIYDREGHESEAIEVGISPRVYRILKK
jgi:hypothetical protein